MMMINVEKCVGGKPGCLKCGDGRGGNDNTAAYCMTTTTYL